MRKVLHIIGVLDDADVNWLVSRGTTEYVTAGTMIIEERKTIDALFLVLEGQFEVRTSGLDDSSIASLYAGEVVGEISFVDSRPPSASVVATRNSRILRIPADLLRRKLADDTAFAARFYLAVSIFLADRLRTTTSRLGYGRWAEDERGDVDEVDEQTMDQIDLAARRFDAILRQLTTY